MDEVACARLDKLEARKVVGVSQALLLIGPCRGLLWGTIGLYFVLLYSENEQLRSPDKQL